MRDNSVRNYFNSQARIYDGKKNSGLMGWIVSKELNTILDMLEIKKGDSVLDAGCGSGYYSEYIREHGGIPFCVDLSAEMVQVAKQKSLDAIVGDLSEINLGKKFDKILVAGVIEFDSDPKKILVNLGNHLTEDGFLILLYNTKSLTGLLYLFFHLIHGVTVKIYSKKGIRSLLKDSGFKVMSEQVCTSFSSVVKAKLI